MSDAPSEKIWTDQQRGAIGHRAGNLVVSASAGSGKTAVLTERVFQLVSGIAPEDAREPVPIDRMLIVTFTEKAAREMRSRIEARLKEAILGGNDRPELRAALDGLPGGWIMTIDAFCRRLVVEHFDRAGVSPEPRVPESAELARLEEETLRGLLEDWAGAEDKSSGRRDELTDLLRGDATGASGLIDDLRKLMRFLESLDDPERWKKGLRERFRQTEAAATLAALPESAAAAAAFGRSASDLADGLEETFALAAARPHDPASIAAWQPLALRLRQIAEGVAAARVLQPDALREEIGAAFEPTLAKLANKTVCGGQLYENEGFRKSILDRFSNSFKKWKEAWFGLDGAQFLTGAKLAAERGGRLLDLAEEALARQLAVRRRRGWVSFNDFERLALSILSDPRDPDLPSDIAHRLRQQFAHVLVDEFQDTSPLQNRIIRRVAHEDLPGNLFIVGDYKQSIYRFRFAEPELFLGLMQGGEFEHLTLSRNFRSRPGILAFANAAFERWMDPAVGEIDYAGAERLEPGREEAPASDPVCIEARWLIEPAGGAAPEADDAGDAPDEAAPTGDPPRGVEAQAAWVARRIKELTGEGGEFRPGDCAILLRGLKGELDTWVAALDREGLRVRAQGIDPLLASPELMDLMAALRLADNPLQDLPLAAAMRSPLGGFSDDDLAAIRLASKRRWFHEAVWQGGGRALPAGEERKGVAVPLPAELATRLAAFLDRLGGWRAKVQTGSAVETLDAILATTGYGFWLANQPDAAARLGKVEFLRGALRRAEATGDGRNPLGEFLEQTDRAAEQNEKFAELPEPAAAKDEAVHLLTIHGAKGLEFPVVFLPRLDRKFMSAKQRDLLFDRREGMALQGIDVERRRRYPTLASRALEDVQQRRERSEELRLLYVALTRASRRIVLVGKVASSDSLRARGARLAGNRRGPMTALARLDAGSPMDLVGPLVEHLNQAANPPQWLDVGEIAGQAEARQEGLPESLRRAFARDGADPAADWATTIRELRTTAAARSIEAAPGIALLPSVDPWESLEGIPQKTTVTALRREANAKADADAINDAAAGNGEFAIEDAAFAEDEILAAGYRTEATLKTPRWAAEATAGSKQKRAPLLDAGQRGTLIHRALALVPLSPAPDAAGIRRAVLRALAESGAVPAEAFPEALALLDLQGIAWFFSTPEGKAMLERPASVSRELPFSARKPVHDWSPEAARAAPHEFVLMQGIMDAVIDEGDFATLLDYKTDRAANEQEISGLIAKYRAQIELYAKSLQSIWGLKGVRKGLVFLAARRIEWLE